MSETPRPSLADARRVVIKIGSALLVDDASGLLRREWLDALADDVAALRKRRQEVIIVSSGAVAVGRGLAAKLGRAVRRTMPPEPAKDVRDWLTAEVRAAVSWEERGAELREHLMASSVVVDPPDNPPAGSGARAPADGPNDGPDNPHRLAAGFLDGTTPAGSPPLLRFWRGEFHRYDCGAYRPVPDDDQRARLTQ